MGEFKLEVQLRRFGESGVWKTSEGVWNSRHFQGRLLSLRLYNAMSAHLWSKPSKVLSDYTGEIQEEDATG